MKSSFKLLALAAASSMLLASPVLHAESSYGYGTVRPISAQARVNVTVSVPALIVLRIGTSGTTIDTANISVGPTAIPGGVSSLAVGNNQATGWDGTAPAVTGAVASAGIEARAWTNGNPGGFLKGEVTTPFPASSGLTAADIGVRSTGMVNVLAHPGNNTGNLTGTRFTNNQVASSVWFYSLSSAGAAAVTAGTHTQQLTYTAFAL